MNLLFLLLGLLTAFFIQGDASQPCAPLKPSWGAMACVCNSSYCDTVPPVPHLAPGTFAVYSTSQSGDRFKLSTDKTSHSANAWLTLEVNKRNKRQKIIGFGGAFTDAAGINIASLPKAAQDKLLQSYFGPDGLEYNIGRIPIASCDFSTRAYSYDDVRGDLSLTHFALAPEDTKYKIPYIQEALRLSGNKLRLFGSPWSAPAWMKTNNNMIGHGSLIGQPGGQYYKAWANYFVKFVQEYQKHGIPMWGLTTQNEPSDGNLDKFPFQAMGWTAELQRDFVKKDLGPALHSHHMDNIKLMVMDDQRLSLPAWPRVIYSDPEAAKYVSGVAVHWYIDGVIPPSVLDSTHALHPDKFILGTEACTGSMPWEPDVMIGDWGRGEQYGKDIIADLNHWVTGWTDWNLALDTQGGPNWVKNFVDSPIIVKSSHGEFYKNPMFYVMGHFSKFLVPGSVNVELRPTIPTKLHSTAFLRPDGSMAAVLLNSETNVEILSIHDEDIGHIHVTVPPKTIKTVLWKSK